MDAILSPVISGLSSYVIEQISIRMGVKPGVDDLIVELEFLLSSAREAEQLKGVDVVRLWIKTVDVAAKDAKGILDDFNRIHKEQSSQDCMQKCLGTCKKESSLYNIGNRLESLQKSVSTIRNRRVEHGIDVLSAEVRKKDREREMEKEKARKLQRAASFQNLEEVVGFEADFETLMEELNGPDPSLRVISIHGMGGLGKTTLAYKLYNSDRLIGFESRVWVCVTQDYAKRDLLKKMIKSHFRHQPEYKPDISDDKDDVDLLHQLKSLLENERYLAVIDDLWDTNAWDLIKTAFPHNGKGSRIIVTTRNKTVAQKEDYSCFVHPLNFLGKEDSWRLFCSRKKSYISGDKMGIQRAKIAHQADLEELVHKCGGLPLAIVELTKLLVRNYQELVQMKKDIWKELEEHSVEIKEILSLSYKLLSDPQKQCFLYLARFPSDNAILTDKLIQLWVAEEFIPDQGNGSVMEDVAEKYLNELAGLNLIQIKKLKMNEQVAQCRVHDLVRYLALQMAMGENFLGIYDSSKQDPRLHGQQRQAIYNGIGEFLDSFPRTNNSKLTSLAVINETRLVILDQIKLCTRFKNLKVLDLISVESKVIPKQIGELVSLTFLGLMGCLEEAIVIPSTIRKLKDLQTLCGSFSSQYECPKEISELTELRHLCFQSFSARIMPGGNLKIGPNQTKLQTLGNVWFKDWIQIDTINLTNLRKLCLRDASAEEHVYYNLESIAKLNSLQTLSIKFHTSVIPPIQPLSLCKCLNRLALFGKLEDTPDFSSLPKTVTELTLSNSELKQDPMLTLGSLANLTALYLDRAYTGNTMACSVDSFVSLKFFKLSALSNLEELQVQKGSLPCLEGFDINGCDKLKPTPGLVVAPIPQMYKFWDSDSEMLVPTS